MSKIHQILYQRKDYRELTKWIRDTNPYCAHCKAWTKPNNRTVDHITPLSVRPDKVFVRANLQMLCKECHADKTIKCDNLFNNTMLIALTKAGLE